VIPLSPTPSFLRHARRALLVLLTAAAPAGTEPVALRTTRVPLDREHPERTAVGPLEYRGGLHVTSSDPRFGGISAMRVLPGGERLVAITDEGSWLTARLVLENGVLRGIAEAEMGPLRPSDATLLPGGDLLVLERGYDANRGITSVRLREVPARDVRAGAVLGGATLAELKTPLTVDNFEGVSAWSAEGETRVLLVSDDNFNAAAGQRTLLMLFRLAVPAVGRPSSPR
jgi:hypothetical protein